MVPASGPQGTSTPLPTRGPVRATAAVVRTSAARNDYGLPEVAGLSAAGCDGTAGTIPAVQAFLTWSSGRQGGSYDRLTTRANRAIPVSHPTAVAAERRRPVRLVLLIVYCRAKSQQPRTYQVRGISARANAYPALPEATGRASRSLPQEEPFGGASRRSRRPLAALPDPPRRSRQEADTPRDASSADSGDRTAGSSMSATLDAHRRRSITVREASAKPGAAAPITPMAH